MVIGFFHHDSMNSSHRLPELEILAPDTAKARGSLYCALPKCKRQIFQSRFLEGSATQKNFKRLQHKEPHGLGSTTNDKILERQVERGLMGICTCDAGTFAETRLSLVDWIDQLAQSNMVSSQDSMK